MTAREVVHIKKRGCVHKRKDAHKRKGAREREGFAYKRKGCAHTRLALERSRQN